MQPSSYERKVLDIILESLKSQNEPSSITPEDQAEIDFMEHMLDNHEPEDCLICSAQ